MRNPKSDRNGKEEPLTINVMYDTHELYGIVTASRTVTVYQE